VYRGWHVHHTQEIDVFCSPSKFLLELHRGAGLKARESRIVPLGILLPVRFQNLQRAEMSTQSAGPRGRDLGVRPCRFLFIGGLVPHKGIQLLLDAFRGLPRSLSLSLSVAGAGPLELLVRQAAANDPRISLHGYVSGAAKERLFAESNVLVVPSTWYENAPATILEAYHRGIPVIASQIGGISELVRSGDTGFLFEPGNVQALRDRMIEFAELSPEKRTLMNARALGESPKFTLDRMVDTYLNLYNTSTHSSYS